MKNNPRNLVTETSLELFDAAEGDALVVDSLLKDKINVDMLNDKICYNLSQCAEKFLKGYLIFNNIQVNKTHNLIEVLELAIKHNDIFHNIRNDCLKLNDYGSELRYGSYEKIEKHEVIDCIKSLKNIYNFEPIKYIREIFIKNKNYRINEDIKLNDDLTYF